MSVAGDLLAVDGRPLRVVRSGSGPPLLLVNGLGASADMWEPLRRRLHGHELIAVDLPGTGGSPPARRPLRVAALADLLHALLDRLGLRTADVLGYSFGGLIAQELARRAHDRVERLVLCATTHGIPSFPANPLAAWLMLTPARYYSRSLARLIVPVIAGGRTARDPSVLRTNLEYRLANPPSVLGYVHQLYAGVGWTSVPWLRTITQPTLILHGDDDPLIALVNARWMARAIPAAQLHVVRGGGHLFLFDDPGAVAGRLAGFLTRPPRPRTAT
jgi:poly(3-hydroxyoctanoate) depolymerase